MQELIYTGFFAKSFVCRLYTIVLIVWSSLDNSVQNVVNSYNHLLTRFFYDFYKFFEHAKRAFMHCSYNFLCCFFLDDFYFQQERVNNKERHPHFFIKVFLEGGQPFITFFFFASVFLSLSLFFLGLSMFQMIFVDSRLH